VEKQGAESDGMVTCGPSTFALHARYPVEGGVLEAEVLEKVFMDLVRYHAYILQDTLNTRKTKLRVTSLVGHRTRRSACTLWIAVAVDLPVVWVWVCLSVCPIACIVPFCLAALTLLGLSSSHSSRVNRW
jgi:hypothetical protein